MGAYRLPADLARIIAEQRRRISDLATEVSNMHEWDMLAFPFAAGWGNFGSGFEAATYGRRGDIVRLQGLVTKSGGTPTVNDVIGTLPAGFRPTSQLRLDFATGGTPSSGQFDIQTDGDVVWISGSTSETDYVSFSGVSFVIT